MCAREPPAEQSACVNPRGGRQAASNATLAPGLPQLALRVPIPQKMSRTPRTDSLAPGPHSDHLPAAIALADAGRTVTALLSDRLRVPTALLSCTEGVWRFEAEGWPDDATRTQAPWGGLGEVLAARPTACSGDEGPAWTGIDLGRGGGARGWMLLLPGAPDVWEGTPVVSQFVPDIGALLDDAAEREHSEGWKRTVQRYHRFCRRLTRAQTADDLYGLILRGLAAQVRRRDRCARRLFRSRATALHRQDPRLSATAGRSPAHCPRRGRDRFRVQLAASGPRGRGRGRSAPPAPLSHRLLRGRAPGRARPGFSASPLLPTAATAGRFRQPIWRRCGCSPTRLRSR